MASTKKIYVLTTLAVCVILAKAGTDQVSGHEGSQGHEDDESSEGSGEMNPQGRFYSLSTCDYRMQPGYMCLSCSRALHCYISNTAIVVDCRGLFPYCRDGRCSRYRGKVCDGAPDTHNLPLTTFNNTIQHSVQGVNENETSSGDSDAAIQTIVTKIEPIIPGVGIASQDEVDSNPMDISQKLNKPIEDLDKNYTLALTDNLVSYR